MTSSSTQPSLTERQDANEGQSVEAAGSAEEAALKDLQEKEHVILHSAWKNWFSKPLLTSQKNTLTISRSRT